MNNVGSPRRTANFLVTFSLKNYAFAIVHKFIAGTVFVCYGPFRSLGIMGKTFAWHWKILVNDTSWRFEDLTSFRQLGPDFANRCRLQQSDFPGGLDLKLLLWTWKCFELSVGSEFSLRVSGGSKATWVLRVHVKTMDALRGKLNTHSNICITTLTIINIAW